MPQTVNGLGFMVARNGQVIYAQAFGNQQVDTVLPIASSSKMPSAAVIMSMVDQGLLDLDKPVGSYLAGKIDWPQDKAAITLRMMLNHTSGLQPNAPCLVRPFLTLRECAQEIADTPLDFAPGTQFEYGGGGFQVAGYIAEAVSGQRWSDLFDQRIGKPLGLTTFNYGVGTNPQIAGSARSDLADYTKDRADVPGGRGLQLAEDTVSRGHHGDGARPGGGRAQAIQPGWQRPARLQLRLVAHRPAGWSCPAPQRLSGRS